MAEFSGGFANRVFQYIVAENQENAVSADEMLGQTEGLGDSASAILIGVVEALKAEVMPVTEQADKISGIISAGTSMTSSMPAFAMHSMG